MEFSGGTPSEQSDGSFNSILSGISSSSYDQSKRRYSPKWENHPQLKPWLTRSPNDLEKPYCKVCEKEIGSSKIDKLLKHCDSKEHKVNCDVFEVNNSYDPVASPKNLSLNIKVILGKIRLAAMFAFQNLSYLLVMTLMPIMQMVDPDSAILENLTRFDRWEMAQVIKHVFTEAHQAYLQWILRRQKFSIIIDESTDVRVMHSMCIVVRFNHEEDGHIVETLLDIEPVYVDAQSRADAVTISNLIITALEKRGIPLENVVSFCSDTCALMMGIHNSVASNLKRRIKQLLIIKCNCHVEQLSAKYAMKKLPATLNILIKDLHAYINSGNGSRRSRWMEAQTIHGVRPLEISKPAFTRWLSIGECVRKILRRLSILITYFESEVRYFKMPKPDELVKENSPIQLLYFLKDRRMYYYLLFLENVLSRLERCNADCQAVEPLVPEERSVMEQLMVDFLNMYMKPDYVDSIEIEFVEPQNPIFMKDLRDIDLGSSEESGSTTMELLINDRSLSNLQKDEVLLNCRNFAVTVCRQLQMRLDFSEKFTQVRNFFHPKNALSEHFHIENPDLSAVFHEFSDFVNDRDIIDQEWRSLLDFQFPENFLEGEIDVFWNRLLKCVDENNHFLFKNLAEFAMTTLLIPNSNASSERVWSKQNLEKTKIRNKLSFKSLRALLLTSSYVVLKGGLLNFKITREMLINCLKLPPRSPGEKKKAADKSFRGIAITPDMIRRAEIEESAFLQRRENRRRNQTIVMRRQTRQYRNKAANYFSRNSHSDRGLDGHRDTVSESDFESDPETDPKPTLPEIPRNNPIPENPRNHQLPEIPLIQNGLIRHEAFMHADGNFYRPVRTCAFDSFCQLLITGFLDHNLTRQEIEGCLTKDIFDMILDVVTSRVVTENFYARRLRLLLTYVQSNDLREIYVIGRHLEVNCSCHVGDCIRKLLPDVPNFIESLTECQLGHPDFRSKNALINVTRAQIVDRDAAKNIIIDVMQQQSNPICGIRMGDWLCQGRRTRSLVHTGNIIFLDIYWPGDNYREEDCLSLNQLPITIDAMEPDRQYILFGFINYTPGHFTAMYRTQEGLWWEFDDYTLQISPRQLEYLSTPVIMCYKKVELE